MLPESQLLGEREAIAALVRGRQELEGKLVRAGGKEFDSLLGLCEDLADIIDDISEISGKKGKIEHAAFETKVKFSRKIRRKAKDLNRFEQEIVEAFDSKHISLEHGRKMAEIIKLLKANKPEKAREAASEFYGLLETGNQLKIAEGGLQKKRAQVERAVRSVSALATDLEWLSSQPPLDAGKAGRHDERARLLEALHHARAATIRKLQSMPLAELLKKADEEGLGSMGFPRLPQQDAESLESFLRKSRLESNSAGQLFELATQSELKLRHLGIDLAGFRQEVAARKAYLSQIMSLHSTGFLSADSEKSPAVAYLSSHHEDAGKAAERLAELARTSGEDEREWSRSKLIEAKKAGLEGFDRAGLEQSLKGLKNLQEILDGKPESAQAAKKNDGGSGILGPLKKFLSGK